MNKKSKKYLVVTAAISLAILLTAGANACSGSGTGADEAATDQQLAQYQKVQPIPFYEWSQYRETLISIQNAQVSGTATTSFFFNTGVANPVKSCPSIGYAVPSTTQLTSPTQWVGSGAVIDQMEPNGSYTGQSTATYVVCVINGVAAPSYWEGFVMTEPGPAHWDRELGMVVNDGAPTVQVETK